MKERWSIQKVIEEASEHNSVLDIGCGSGTILKKVAARQRVGVDVCQKAIDVAKKGNNGVFFLCCDLMNLVSILGPNTIECVIGIDVIEHFTKEEANNLLWKCETIATKELIFFIPVGDHPQTKDDRGFRNDFYQTHRSTWYPKDMEALGYEVFHYPNWHANILPPKEKGAMFCRKKLRWFQ